LTLISPTNLLNQMASLAALVMAMYSASVEHSAVQGCFLLPQVIGLDPSRKKYHDTNFQSWTSPTRSTSEKHISSFDSSKSYSPQFPLCIETSVLQHLSGGFEASLRTC
jgi:hypothetical protein